MSPVTIRHTAPLTCPSCGCEITGRWLSGQDTADQQCGCGHAFEATWPGFRFEPEVVIVRRPPGEEAGHDAA